MHSRPTGADLGANYIPKLAVIVYQDAAIDAWQNKKFYLESHAIGPSGEILAGQPLLQETLNEVVDVFFDERKNRSSLSGFMPSNLLSYEMLPGGYYSMTWFQPAQTKVIHFSGSLKIPSGEAAVPALIYKVDRKELLVFAIKSNERPDLKTPLFRAPFHNIYEDGRVCLGTADVKKPEEKTFINEMQYWEDLFWKSEFSHLNGQSCPTKTNINLLWKKLVNDKKNQWDNDELKAFKNHTLKSLFA